MLLRKVVAVKRAMPSAIILPQTADKDTRALSDSYTPATDYETFIQRIDEMIETYKKLLERNASDYVQGGSLFYLLSLKASLTGEVDELLSFVTTQPELYHTWFTDFLTEIEKMQPGFLHATGEKIGTSLLHKLKNYPIERLKNLEHPAANTVGLFLFGCYLASKPHFEKACRYLFRSILLSMHWIPSEQSKLLKTAHAQTGLAAVAARGFDTAIKFQTAFTSLLDQFLVDKTLPASLLARLGNDELISVKPHKENLFAGLSTKPVDSLPSKNNAIALSNPLSEPAVIARLILTGTEELAPPPAVLKRAVALFIAEARDLCSSSLEHLDTVRHYLYLLDADRVTPAQLRKIVNAVAPYFDQPGVEEDANKFIITLHDKGWLQKLNMKSLKRFASMLRAYDEEAKRENYPRDYRGSPKETLEILDEAIRTNEDTKQPQPV